MAKFDLLIDTITSHAFAATSLLECPGDSDNDILYISSDGSDDTWFELPGGQKARVTGTIYFKQVFSDKITIPYMENSLGLDATALNFTIGGGGSGGTTSTNTDPNAVKKIDVTNTLTSTSVSKPLAANQGKILNDKSIASVKIDATGEIHLTTVDGTILKTTPLPSGRLIGSNATIATLPLVDADGNVARKGDYVFLTNTDGLNPPGFYKYSGTNYVLDFEIASTSLRGDPVADQAALLALAPKEFEMRMLLDSKKVYTYTNIPTAKETANTKSLPSGTGLWILEEESTGTTLHSISSTAL